ncbi:MAG: carbohydrate-binding domain-containing protein, partial [Akkermansiaceae bacterium]|nr:carbohydrate-binding domain-containing protein [Akkermansiaceae bacterium]
MKTTLALLAVTASVAFAQGPLAPPAAPAPTMKTLDQIEARTPISAPQNITQSGSYYLTGNVNGQITISASDVTLNLNGFTLTSSGDGIGINNQGTFSNVTIRNGSVVGPGSMTFTGAVAGTWSGFSGRGIIAYGRTAGNVSGQNIRIEGVTVRGFDQGITLASFEESDGGRHLISNCLIREFGFYGINASQCCVRDCVIRSGTGT